MPDTESQHRRRRELIIETWVKLGSPPATARILGRIQRVLAQEFGRDAAFSPASIARALADEGAELVHPDVIECDARWRAARLKKSAVYARENRTKPLTLKNAEALLRKFESLRRKRSENNDAEALRRLREAALNEKAKAQLLVRDPSISEPLQEAQQEIAAWFRVWLQTPEIFDDWLDLRKRSREFQKIFLQAKSMRGPSA